MNTINAAHAVAAGSITFWDSINLVAAAAICLAVGLAWHWSVFTELVSSLKRSARSLHTLIRLRCPSQMLSIFGAFARRPARES